MIDQNFFVSDVNWLKAVDKEAPLTGSETRRTYQVNQRAP